jgi:hypothetical protein
MINASLDPQPPLTGKSRRSSRRRLLTGSGFLIVLFLGAVALLVTVPRMLGPSEKPASLAVASLPFWNLSAGQTVLAANRGTFNEVSPWIYGITSNGQIVAQAMPGRAAEIAAGMAQLRTLGIPLVPSIANRTNGQWAYEPVANMLHNPAAMTRHINDIVTLVQRERYDGIDIDYEDLPATDRQAFTTFVTRLADALHDKNKILTIAVFAKTTDAGEDGRNAGRHRCGGRRGPDHGIRLQLVRVNSGTGRAAALGPRGADLRQDSDTRREDRARSCGFWLRLGGRRPGRSGHLDPMFRTRQGV